MVNRVLYGDTNTGIPAVYRHQESKDTDLRQCHDIIALEEYPALLSGLTRSLHFTLSPDFGGDNVDQASPPSTVQ